MEGTEHKHQLSDFFFIVYKIITIMLLSMCLNQKRINAKFKKNNQMNICRYVLFQLLLEQNQISLSKQEKE